MTDTLDETLRQGLHALGDSHLTLQPDVVAEDVAYRRAARRRRRTISRTSAGAAAAVAIAVVLAALVLREDSSSLVTADGRTLLPLSEAAGSPMDSVLVVPGGTELLGTVFPAAVEGNWDAVLVVTGDDPFAVLRDLVDQVEESGFDVSAFSTNGAACDLSRQSAIECAVYASQKDAPESYEFSLRWGDLDGASFRHVLVRRRSHGIWFPPNLTSVETDLPPSPAPIDEWHGPEVGEPVASPPEAFDESIVVLEPGGRVTGPPGHSWSLTGGYNVVVTLDAGADAKEVVAAYAAQFEELGFEGTISETTFEGHGAVAARYGTAGGGEIEATVVEDSEAGRSFLLLSRADD